MVRKGLSQNALTLILGILLMLFVLAVNTGFAPSEAFKDFIKKVPFLNRIAPEPAVENPEPIDAIGVCGGLCSNKLKSCAIDQKCVEDDSQDNPLIGKCSPDPVCAANVPAGDVLRFYAVTEGGDRLSYKIYEQADPAQMYQLEAGDCLQYDVWIANDAGGLGGIEIETSDSKKWGNDNKFADTNGQKAALGPSSKLHAEGEDISGYAYRKWYKRMVPIFTDTDPDQTMAGRSVKSINLVTEQGSYSQVPVVSYYDNVKFVSCASPAAVKKVIFENTLQKNGPSSGGGFKDVKMDVIAYGSMASVPDYHDHGTQVLLFNAVNSAGDGGIYWRMGKVDYTVQPGDTIEYDVCVVSPYSDTGGIDVFKDNGKNGWKDIDKSGVLWLSGVDCSSGSLDGMSNKWRDQNLVDGHPQCDLRQKYSKTLALGKWYHRVMIVPYDKVKDKDKITWLDAAAENDNSGSYTVYYDNIFITNADKISQAVYQDGLPSANEKHYSDGSYTATMTPVSPPAPGVCVPADVTLRSYVK